MKPKSLVLFSVAVGFGLVAMLGARQFLSSRGQGVEKVRVLVARTEVEPGVKLNDELVAFRDIPRDAVPPSAVFKPEQYLERALKVRAFPGQVIQVAQLGEKGQFGTSLDIPKGMRLVTVPASTTLTHSGIMKPGDRVDVVLTYKQQANKNRNNQTLTKTLLEYIQVYAMGSQRMGSEDAEAGAAAKDVKNVTLLVTPLQVEIMSLAQSKGQIHLALRGVLDKDEVASKGTDDAALEFLRSELSDQNQLPSEVAEAPPAEAVPTPPEPQPPEPKPSFAEFVQTEPVVAPVPVETPKWKMEVFQGDERKVYELDVPTDAESGAVKAEPLPQAPGTKTTSASSIWNSPLTQWLTGNQRARSTATTMSP